MPGFMLALLCVAGILWLALLPILVRRVHCLLALHRPNYRGDSIPAAYGLLIPLWSVPALLVLMRGGHDSRPSLALLIAVTGFGFLGFLDDLRGDRNASGLKGHARELLANRRVTTGLVKAVGGIALGIVITRFILDRTWPDSLLSGAVTALSANALNLLDLRPGRAGASFLLGAAALESIALTLGLYVVSLGLACVIVPAIAEWIPDSRGRVMMGDTGSNLLGASLGVTFILAVPGTAWQVSALLLLLAFHVLAERYSLTRIIEESPLLHRIDSWTGVR